MIMPFIETLRKANWAASSPEQRKDALNQLEKWIARQDGRNPCPVGKEPLGPTTRGQHVYFPDGSEKIDLNKYLVESDEPYQAVETLMHEGRHSYQHQATQHPELAENEQQWQDWKISQEGGYIQPNQLEPSKYRMQPTEIDARAAARERTDSLYESVFEDKDYAAYKAQKIQEEMDYIEEARYELGDNYEQVARQAVQEQYQQSQNAQLEQSSQPVFDPSAQTKSEPNQAEMNQDNASAEQVSEAAPSQEKPLSYETYNQLRDENLSYYEQLRDHATQMTEKGYADIADEDRVEMQKVSERLGNLQKERDRTYDPTGKPRELPPTQENASSQIDNKPDDALKADQAKSLDQGAEKALTNPENPTENQGYENATAAAMSELSFEPTIDEHETLENLGDGIAEEGVTPTLSSAAGPALEAAAPEVIEGVEDLSSDMETSAAEPQSALDIDPESYEESEDEDYKYGMGF